MIIIRPLTSRKLARLWLA